MENYKITLINIFIGILFIILVQVIINPVGARFPFQDLMVHDYWAVGKLNFFRDYLSNFGSVINFSEGLGIDIRVNVKDQISFFDPALFLSLFFTSFVAVQIKLIIFHSMGFIYFYLLLNNYSKNKHLILSLSLLLISSLQYISESSTLTTSNYLLVLPFVYYFQQFSNYNLKSLTLIITLIFILVGNTDLNLIFIMPLVFVWVSEFNVKQLLSKKYFITYFLFFIIIGVSKYNYYIFNFGDYFPSITSNNLGEVSMAQALNLLDKIFKSLFFPRIPGPITLFIFAPVIFILAFYPLNKKIIPLYVIIFFSILFYLLPFIITPLKGHIPSFVRYHFCITSIIIYFYSCKFILTEKIPSKFKYIYSFSVFLIFGYLIYKGEIFYYSIITAIIFILISTSLYSIIIDKKIKLNSYIVPILIFAFCLTGMKGGFNYSISRTIDRDFAKLYNNDLNECIKNNIDLSGIVITAYNPYFANTGRHDLILPIIEQPNLNLGRSFFHWRHSYPTLTSKSYSSSGAIGSTLNSVNFFPPSINAINSVGFKDFLKFSKANNLISINHTHDKNKNLTFIKNCKLKREIKLNKGSDNSKLEAFDTFFHDVNIYRMDRNDGIKLIFDKHKIEIKLEKGNAIKDKEISLPIIFWPSLIVENNKITLNKNKDGFVSIIPLEDIEEDFTFNIRSRDLTIFSPVYLYLFLFLSIFVFNIFFKKKLKTKD